VECLICVVHTTTIDLPTYSLPANILFGVGKFGCCFLVSLFVNSRKVMTMLNKSAERLTQGKEALARGDAKQAIKDFSVSISLNPSIEAYFLRAQANYSASNVRNSLQDLARAQELCESLPDNTGWLEQIEFARNRCEGAFKKSEAPAVKATISVLLPTSIEDFGNVVTKLANRPDLSTDGQTLFRKGGTVIYDIKFHDRNVDWAENMLAIREPEPFPPGVAEYITEHFQFILLTAPNWDIVQHTDGQVGLATEFLQTLELLMRALSIPAALLRTSNSVFTREEVQSFIDEVSSENLVTAYARLYNAGNEMFSAGMHALGYADAAIPFALIPVESAGAVLDEFLLFQVINQTWEWEVPIAFSSAVTGFTYQAELRNCDRFNVPGEARFNPNGVWTFTQRLS
jgi:hypothetical protein